MCIYSNVGVYPVSHSGLTHLEFFIPRAACPAKVDFPEKFRKRCITQIFEPLFPFLQSHHFQI